MMPMIRTIFRKRLLYNKPLCTLLSVLALVAALLVPSKALQAQQVTASHTWFAKSGSWQKVTIGENSVIKQTFQFDRPKIQVPTPYLMYKSVFLEPPEASADRFDQVSFDFRADQFYSADGQAEMAVFVNGNNDKELYFIRLTFNDKNFYRISLQRSDIVDKKKALNVFGNFKVLEIAREDIVVRRFQGQSYRLTVFQDRKYVKVALNGRQIFISPWEKQYKQNVFAVGFRGANCWIDNVEIRIDNRVVYFEDFTNPNLKGIRIQ